MIPYDEIKYAVLRYIFKLVLALQFIFRIDNLDIEYLK